MKKHDKVVAPVKGGWIVRDAVTGRFKEVQKTSGETARLSGASLSAVKGVSGKRSAALRRLADR